MGLLMLGIQIQTDEPLRQPSAFEVKVVDRQALTDVVVEVTHMSTARRTKRFGTPWKPLSTSPQVAWANITVAGMAHWLYVQDAPGGKIPNYVLSRQSGHLPNPPLQPGT